MNRRILFIFIFLGIYCNSFSQKSPNWGIWNQLTGSWVGEGNGKPGQGEGECSFTFDLDKNILVRKNHTVISAIKDKKEVIHDDLMIIYADSLGLTNRAIYFDNESHVINYSIINSDTTIILTSEIRLGLPQFRLTYSFVNKETLTSKFEISLNSKDFFTYIEGTSKKKL